MFNDVENIEGTDAQARWSGFLADIFISEPHMCLICGFRVSSSFFPFFSFSVIRTSVWSPHPQRCQTLQVWSLTSSIRFVVNRSC